MQRRTTRIAAGLAAAASVLALTACGSGFSGGSSASGSSSSGNGLTSSKSALTVLIGSSGDAETAAVKSAVADWSQTSGTKATVRPPATCNQQLSQGFAAEKPADVFYLDRTRSPATPATARCSPTATCSTNKGDFYPSLVKNFTYDGKFYCAPKDFSTLQLIINTDLWKAAGPHRRRHPDDLGPARRRSRRSSPRATASGLVIERRVRPARRLHGAGRRHLINDDGTKADGQQPRERRRRSPTCRSPAAGG